MSKFLITGGDGFIGTFVAHELLEAGHEVVSYDAHRSWVPYDVSLYPGYLDIRISDITRGMKRVIGDTTDRGKFAEVLEATQPQYVIHLAALPLADASNKYGTQAKTTILDATEVILDCIREYMRKHQDFRRFTYASSSMVYGDFQMDDNGQPIPAKESDPLDPRKSMYAAYKAMGELVVRSFGHVHKIPTTIIRPSAVYGPTDANRRVTEIFVNNALTGKTLKVNNADRMLDFTYVTDTAHGIVLATTSKKGEGETFNITAGCARSLGECADIIAEIVPDVKIEKIVLEDNYRPIRGTLDISKAKELLGYQPRFDLKRGMEDYIQFIVRAGVLKNITARAKEQLGMKGFIDDENRVLYKGTEGQTLSQSVA